MGYQKYVIIDIPFSRKAFTIFFIQKLEILRSKFSHKIALDLSVIELQKVFGDHWYVLKSSNSSTEAKIIGMVSLNFRAKTSKEYCENR